MLNRTRNKRRYNEANYDEFMVRIRRDSDLADRVAAHRQDGQSINSLVTRLLAAHFDVPVPFKWFEYRRVKAIYP